ncbi:hypothetical protein BU14_0075s0011 [Porphyra umbilicalis]|uniref:Uncharacterized protein n=1 Tax=Porphyra umbilicalis TaxID=2786 RepID=A0A1X6PFA1_PORUM|nr:hypothetical protein BU14_0075s0011 [Porphyra umbilicalis]|eukprot:OSX79521.1 hypothetical protein BU14_0075s0011 [Porphyra umbilicalis]
MGGGRDGTHLVNTACMALNGPEGGGHGGGAGRGDAGRARRGEKGKWGRRVGEGTSENGSARDAPCGPRRCDHDAVVTCRSHGGGGEHAISTAAVPGRTRC